MEVTLKKKMVLGNKRYYPTNDTALLLVELKRCAVHNNRKAIVKCLNDKEIKVLKKLGFKIVITE